MTSPSYFKDFLQAKRNIENITPYCKSISRGILSNEWSGIDCDKCLYLYSTWARGYLNPLLANINTIKSIWVSSFVFIIKYKRNISILASTNMSFLYILLCISTSFAFSTVEIIHSNACLSVVNAEIIADKKNNITFPSSHHCLYVQNMNICPSKWPLSLYTYLFLRIWVLSATLGGYYYSDILSHFKYIEYYLVPSYNYFGPFSLTKWLL